MLVTNHSVYLFAYDAKSTKCSQPRLGIVLTVTKLDYFVFTHNLASAAGHGSLALRGTSAPPFDSKPGQREGN